MACSVALLTSRPSSQEEKKPRLSRFPTGVTVTVGILLSYSSVVTKMRKYESRWKSKNSGSPLLTNKINGLKGIRKGLPIESLGLLVLMRMTKGDGDVGIHWNGNTNRWKDADVLSAQAHIVDS